MSIAAGMLNAVLPATVLALIEAVPVVSAAAVLDGADGLLVRGGQVGIALKILRSVSVEDIARYLPS